MKAHEPHDDAFDNARTFSLPFLFRIISMIAFAISWPLSIANSPPYVLTRTLAAIGFVLALVVGYRRHGPLFVRVGIGIAFFGGALSVAVYSGSAASVWQAPSEGRHPFDDFGGFLAGTVLVLVFPIVLGILVLLLRAWTWSAHDRMIYTSSTGGKEV
ncbi:MAG TPA: hypothetical protein VFI31_25730 [Pirellulales bacterium]|nr:hypothetical protein [Pirellulales bacterium]